MKLKPVSEWEFKVKGYWVLVPWISIFVTLFVIGKSIADSF